RASCTLYVRSPSGEARPRAAGGGSGPRCGRRLFEGVTLCLLVAMTSAQATTPTPAHAIASGSRSGAAEDMPEELRGDVRLLGDLLGVVLAESGGPDLLDDVEALRSLAIEAYAESDSDAIERAEDLVETFTLERAEAVARAFTTYFHLVNLAEEYHRVRV